MADHPLVIAVAGYSSKAAAMRDYRRLCDAEAGHDRVSAALVEKGADGRLTVDRYHSPPECMAGGVALLGGALLVLAAPLGIFFLVPVMATSTAWAGVAAIVAHLWNDVPKGMLRNMSDLVEMTQTALVVVALDHSGKDLEALLAGAPSVVVTDLTPTDVEADFSKAIEEAETTGG
jgi:uncharacterized membrane protein